MFLATVLGVSGNLQDEVAVSFFTVINRCLSCYLPRPEQALTSSSFAECQFQQGRGIYLQVRHRISWSHWTGLCLSGGNMRWQCCKFYNQTFYENLSIGNMMTIESWYIFWESTHFSTPLGILPLFILCLVVSLEILQQFGVFFYIFASMW